MQASLYNLVALGLCVAMAAVFSATDVLSRCSRRCAGLRPVSNRFMLAFLGAGLLLLGAGFGLCRGAVVPPWWGGCFGFDFHLGLLAQSILALALGFGLWWGGYWAGGDGKLFALLTLLFPAALLPSRPPLCSSGLVLLHNALMAFLLFVPLDVAVTLVRVTFFGGAARGGPEGQPAPGGFRQLLKKRIDSFRSQGLVRSFFVFLAVFLAIQAARGFVRQHFLLGFLSDPTVIYLALFLMFSAVRRLARSRWALAAFVGVSALLAGYMFATSPDWPASLLHSVALSASLVLLRFLYEVWLDGWEFHRVPWTEITKGMVLSPASLALFQTRQRFWQAWFESAPMEGLSQAQAEALREWFQKNEPEGSLEITRTIPFAPAFLASVILTALLGGPLMLL